MKKIFKISIAIVILMIAFILAIPVLFEDKILDLIKHSTNNNLNATLDFEDGDLSVWRSFPSTQISLENVSIINKAPFEGDTLFFAKTFTLSTPLIDLFKKNSDISITNFAVDDAAFMIKINDTGIRNYDIAIKPTSQDNEIEASDGIQLNLMSYEISKSSVSYYDASSKIEFQLTNIEHSGNGNLSSDQSKLKTQTSANITFQKDSVAYLKNNKLSLDALLAIDLTDNTYRFLENELILNQLPLTFEGFIKVNETNQEVDLSFKTPSSDFKNFLALVPEVYSKNIDGVTTTGNFDIQGTIAGIVDDKHIPKFNIRINSDKASFKYPDLSKSLTNINIISNIANESGYSKDTYVRVDTLSFMIDDEVFNAKAELKEITENMKVEASLKGIVDLGSLEEIYPAEAFKGLSGIVDLDATTNFDMASIEKEQYERTTIDGSFKLSDFTYDSSEMKSPINVASAGIYFRPKKVNLTDFAATLGKTDIEATGTIDNLLGFLFNNENVAGNFNVNSNTFAINDFMVSDEKEETNEDKISADRIKIPSFLDCTINAKANNVLYDNITLQNVTTIMIIKDQMVELKDVRSNIFGGDLGLNGNVSTKNEVSKFQLELDVTKFDISQSFKQLELFEALAPIANVVSGKMDANINLSGNLNDDLTPNINSLNGTMLTQLLSSKLTADKAPLLQRLSQQLPFLDVSKLNLDKLKTALTFKDGKVTLKPFNLMYDDIEIAISGGHGFDKSLAYDAVFDVPAKYLGKEAERLIAELDAPDSESIKIPVSALISGKFSSPNIKTDLNAAVTNLSKQIAAKKKDQLVEQGKDKITDALGGLLGKKSNDSTRVDSVKTNATKDAARDLLDGLFNRKKKKKDTAN